MRNIFLTIFALVCLTAGAQTLPQTGGIYYAYPGPTSQLTPAPDGYETFYISHYGRHGSRWVTEDKRYTDVADAFADTTQLTALGLDVKHRLDTVLADALGRSGSLSPLGQRQHHDIAARMFGNYPSVFTDSARIDAVSSTSLRCAMSMSYFTEGLKELNPSLNVTRTAYDKDMQYIAYTSPEGKVFSADTAEWRKEYLFFVDTIYNPDRLINSLFTDAGAMDHAERVKLANGLYWITSDMQNVEPDIDFYDIFTEDELIALWRTINARMYVCNGNAPMANSVMIHCADNLLRDFIDKADAALSGNGVSANLRFGHDTHLLRLLALIGIEGCTEEETDMNRFHEVWQDYKFSPMAANLQMVFYKNTEGEILVKLLLNENEVTVPLDTDCQPYYNWAALRNYLIERLSF